MSAQEKLKKKEWAHDGMAKRLDIAEALSTSTLNDLSKKEKMIQEQVKLIKKNKRRVAVMHCVPKIRKLWQLQKSLRNKC